MVAVVGPVGGCRLTSLLISLVLLSLRCHAQKLAQEEVDALKIIGSKLKKNWNFTVDPCSRTAGWVEVESETSNRSISSSVTCICDSMTCHVTFIELKGQNLAGELPDEFANLTHLTQLDLTRNYLNGSIPAAWSTLPLVNMSLLGNRISGRIPEELGNITTLQSLVLDDNLLQGPIPASLGKTSLNRLFVSGNNLSGELPDSLGNLKNMNDFRIDGNPISGKIPGFFGKWTQIQKLCMQGTSLEGPFPPNFANLSSIIELRVSDLKRGDGMFPPLENMKDMKNLVLKNLSISGELPKYIGEMTKLKLLDLSFNNLIGHIPSSYLEMPSIKYMYLTNNMLTGTIPYFSGQKNLDLSYNNFTGSRPNSCQLGNVNLVSSYSSTDNISMGCLQRNPACPEKPKNYNLFINCGGGHETIGEYDYEQDTSIFGQSNYVQSDSRKWAYSSTGLFMNNDKEPYIATNTSLLNMSNSELYTNARLSPLSLKYYGICLQKGNYTVKLHFAEIMFMPEKTFASVGRRLFDVSIQGQNVLHDFDIAKEANGIGKEVIKNYTTIVDGTLEIHLYWAGKGTYSVPHRNVYGPLISAISVTPNFDPDTGEKKLSVGTIVGIVVASCTVIILIVGILWFYSKRKNVENSELRELESHTAYFSLKQIEVATNDFHPANKIGEGGFGPVYKGTLPDRSVIAVKQLSSKSKQGNREFINEIGMISALQHHNLVKLYGCCIEGNQLLVIYEYMENNSLARALFGDERACLKLDWKTRRKICLGIARGLTYLHEESRLKIVHRDIKATNILLDKDLNAKISDFGLARLDEEENTHISTRIVGTIGYMAPEYAMRGYLTDKADVYSFGVVMLETVSGVSNTNYRPKEEFVNLLDWAYVLQEKGSLLELVDPKLGTNYSKEEALQMLNLALVCTNQSPTLRPLMSRVVSLLDNRTPVHDQSVKPAASKSEDMRFKSFEEVYSDSQTRSILGDAPWSNSSMSIHTSQEEALRSSPEKLHSDYAGSSTIERNK